MIGLLLWGLISLPSVEAHRPNGKHKLESYHLHKDVRHPGSHCASQHRVHKRSLKPTPYRMPPKSHWVWVAGHWGGPPDNQRWVEGRWAIQPNAPRRWVPGHWESR